MRTHIGWLGLGLLTAAPLLAQDGQLDPDFAGAGFVLPDPSVVAGEFVAHTATGVALDAQGRYVVSGVAARSTGGIDCVVMRLLPSGELDTSFAAPRGIRTLSAGVAAYPQDFCYAVQVLPDGRVLLSGAAANSAQTDFSGLLLMLTTQGNLDTGFSGNGAFLIATELPALFSSDLNSALERLLVDASGRILGLGTLSNDSQSSRTPYLLRFDASSGALDTSFGNVEAVPGVLALYSRDPPNQVSSRADALALDALGRVLVLTDTGSEAVVFRLGSDGAFDPDFGAGMTAAGGNGRGYVESCPIAQDLRLDAAGRMLLLCSQPGDVTGIVRLFADGQPDLDFGNGGFAPFTASTATGSYGAGRLAVQADGALLAGGRFFVTAAQQVIYGASDLHAVRLLAGGQADLGYGYNAGITRLRYAAPDGSLSDTRAELAADLLVDPAGRLVLVGERRGPGNALQMTVTRLLGPRPDALFADGYE